MNKKYLDVPFEIKAEDITEDGVFRGYGSLFNNTPDAYGDVVARGAFTETLAKGGRNRSGIPMLHQHRSDQIPGVWTSLAEDKKGLDTQGKLALKTQLGNDVYEIMKLGAETGTFRFGLSIGYDTVEYEMDAKRKVRTLKKVDLWELSIVTFPAKIGADVTSVKDSIQQATTERELERALRDSDLFSKADAQHIISLCKSVLRDSGRIGNDGLSLILDSLKEVNMNIGLEEKGIGGSKSLPLDSGTAWDAVAAVNRIREWAGGPSKDDVNFARYRQAFVWYSSVDPNAFGSYKLPFADVIGGSLKARWGGVFRAMSAVLGARGGVNIPATDKRKAYNFLADYYKKFDKPVPDFKDYSVEEWNGLYPSESVKAGMSDILDSLQQINA